MDPYRPDDPAALVACDICGDRVAQAAVQFTAGGARACEACARLVRKPVKEAVFLADPREPPPTSAPLVVPEPPHRQGAGADTSSDVLAGVSPSDFVKGFGLGATLYFIGVALFADHPFRPRTHLGVAAILEVFILVLTVLRRDDGSSAGFRVGLRVFGVLLAGFVVIILLS